MEILNGIWANIEAVTFGGISIIILTNALTQAVKDLIPVDHRVMPYIIGVVLALLATGLSFGGVLAGLVVGYLSASVYNTFGTRKP